VPDPAPVQGPLLMAARPKGLRPGVAQVPTTTAPSTPVPATKHQRGAHGEKPRSDGQSRHGKRGSGRASGASHEHGHRTPAPQHAAKQQDRQAKHKLQGKQDRPAKHEHRAKQAHQAKRQHQAKQTRQVKQQHRARLGHGRAHRG
jgi:hypothetical protein